LFWSSDSCDKNLCKMMTPETYWKPWKFISSSLRVWKAGRPPFSLASLR
jgi:hypothetical protein